MATSKPASGNDPAEWTQGPDTVSPRRTPGWAMPETVRVAPAEHTSPGEHVQPANPDAGPRLPNRRQR